VGRPNQTKPFSDEHIWPDALGGDYLSPFWRTDDVCAKCNSISGVFIDGSFIKSWPITAERAFGANEYLSMGRANVGVLPLDYIGPLRDMPTREGEIAEYWCGPCGANIIHIRPDDKEKHWNSYAGGDPRVKTSTAGRAYIALTSDNWFWIDVSLASFKSHFTKARRFVVNMDVPSRWGNLFENPDVRDPTQADDMKVVRIVTSAGQNGDFIKAQPVIKVDTGTRFLAKLALALGYRLWGTSFLATRYAEYLRMGFWEADSEKRRTIPIRGTNFWHSQDFGGLQKILSWRGGWVLLLKAVDQDLFLSVTSPSGRMMTVVVCDDPELMGECDPAYWDGSVWLTIPSLGEAVGPLPLSMYVAHQTNASRVPELEILAGKRHDLTCLPPCSPENGNF
jgi:HNH endonuclease